MDRGNIGGCCDGHDDGMKKCVDDDGLGPFVVTWRCDERESCTQILLLILLMA
jgi:hypothetical protein